MHNLGDDRELDRLSREAAGRYMPPGKPDWNALSAALDKEMPVEEKKRRTPMFWWILPVVLAGGAAAYWFINDKSTEPSAPIPALKEAVVTAPVKPGQATTGIARIQPAAPAETNDAANETRAQKLTGSHSVNDGPLAFNKTKNITGNEDPAKDTQAKQPGAQRKVAPIAFAGSPEDKTPAEQNNAASAKSSTNAIPAPRNQTTEQEKVAQVADGAGTTGNATEAQPAGLPGESKSETPATGASDTNATLIKKPALQQAGKGFSISALAGVDESTVKFKYGNEVGFNLGVMAGYHFNRRLSIHTGAIYTQKNYKLAGEDFTAPKGSWASYYKLNNVEGYCRMWEVPLLMRYTVSQGNRSSVFLSTGLSSYFMTREDYDYRYYNSAGTLVSRNMGYNSTDTHMMSIVHLSAGFERRMSNNLSLLIEPYAKLPLGGVGFGSIRLSSFGLNLGVQFRQPSKK